MLGVRDGHLARRARRDGRRYSQLGVPRYFGPDYRLAVPTDPSMTNMNSDAYLDKYTQVILQQLSEIEHAPSVPFHKVPKDFYPTDHRDAVADVADPDVRTDQDETRRAHEAEFYDGERDVDDKSALAAEKGVATSEENRASKGSKSILSSDKSSKAKQRKQQQYAPGTECTAGAAEVPMEEA